MPSRVEIHPQALAEVRKAYQWYRKRSPSAAVAFLAEIEWALAMIAETPERWPPYMFNSRRLLLSRFPFSVVYRAREKKIQVIAVVHDRRKPGYWKRRAH
jgi:toxin ParE1/3/4